MNAYASHQTAPSVFESGLQNTAAGSAHRPVEPTAQNREAVSPPPSYEEATALPPSYEEATAQPPSYEQATALPPSYEEAVAITPAADQTANEGLSPPPPYSAH